MYGYGYYGEWIIENIDNPWKGIIDRDPAKQGKKTNGITIVSVEKNKKNASVCIANRYSHKEILATLLEKGFSRDKIIDLGEYLERLEKRQYFDVPVLLRDRITTFLDVGALDGKTTQNFIEWKRNCKGAKYI